MSEEQNVYAVDTVVATAVPKTQEMLLRLTSRNDDPDFTAILPVHDVGPLIVELASELTKMPVNPSADVMATMMLTGAHPTWTQDNQPVLLLQLNGQVAVAVKIEPENLDRLSHAIERLREGPTRAPLKPQ